jgi:hypothetical protein
MKVLLANAAAPDMRPESAPEHGSKIKGFVPERSLVLALTVSEESSIQNRGRRLAKNAIIANDHTDGPSLIEPPTHSHRGRLIPVAK